MPISSSAVWIVLALGSARVLEYNYGPARVGVEDFRSSVNRFWRCGAYVPNAGGLEAEATSGVVSRQRRLYAGLHTTILQACRVWLPFDVEVDV